MIDVHEINEQTTKVETSNQDFSSAKPRKNDGYVISYPRYDGRVRSCKRVYSATEY